MAVSENGVAKLDGSAESARLGRARMRSPTGPTRRRSNPHHRHALIQGGAPRAARELFAGAVFEFQGAGGATDHVTEGGAFAAGAAVLVQEPCAEDRAEHQADEDEDEKAEADAD